MGTGLILLLYYISPIIYADSAYERPVYAPRMPRNPMVLLWPSVMNTAVIEGQEQKFSYRQHEDTLLMIECSSKKESVATDSEIPEFTLSQVKSALVWNEEIPRRQQFWNELFPKLIEWLSTEALKCGIYSIFTEARKEIYRFIRANRSNWINAVQELAYTLLQVVAVIHKKTGAFEYGHLDWVETWFGAYEYWYPRHPDPLDYLQKFILDSFDIVISWLVDYLGQRAGARDTFRPNFCRLAYLPDNCSFSSFSFRPVQTLQTKWNLNGDPDIICALQNSQMFTESPLPYPFPHDFLLEALDPPDRIKAMAHAFVTCNLTRPCEGTHPYFSSRHTIKIGYRGSGEYNETIIRIPNPTSCTFTCSDIPKHFKHNAYALAHVTAEHFNNYVYPHAYMATAEMYNYICKLADTTPKNLYMNCQHRIVAKYLYEREYKICCKTKKPCCKKGNCEVVTDWLVHTKFVIVSNFTLRTRQKRFPEIKELDI